MLKDHDLESHLVHGCIRIQIHKEKADNRYLQDYLRHIPLDTDLNAIVDLSHIKVTVEFWGESKEKEL